VARFRWCVCERRGLLEATKSCLIGRRELGLILYIGTYDQSVDEGERCGSVHREEVGARMAGGVEKRKMPGRAARLGSFQEMTGPRGERRKKKVPRRAARRTTRTGNIAVQKSDAPEVGEDLRDEEDTTRGAMVETWRRWLVKKRGPGDSHIRKTARSRSCLPLRQRRWTTGGGAQKWY